MRHGTWLGLAAAGLTSLASLAARAGDPAAPPAPDDVQTVEMAPALPAGGDAARVLERAEAAVDAGRLDEARELYELVVRVAPESPEAREARRALRLMYAPRRAVPGPPEPPSPVPVPEAREPRPAPRAGSLVYRLEPYSLRTGERLRLSTWEKTDFVVTAFTYGASVGLSTSAAVDRARDSTFLGFVLLGSSVYTVAALTYLGVAEPDRGDLPLALAIASYAPTTVALGAAALFDDADEEDVFLAAGVAGLLAFPTALFAASANSTDPGDTQLVRDAGFWGMALGFGGMMAFGGHVEATQWGSWYNEPSGRSVAAASLLGLYAGMGLGLAATGSTAISLERVRVATWGGYGGVVLGGLVGTLIDTDTSIFRGALFGGLGGLATAFVMSEDLDRIPPEAPMVRDERDWHASLVPLPVLDSRGRAGLGLGLALALP